MRALCGALLVATLHACSVNSAKPVEPAVLVGNWLMLDDRIPYPGGCNSSAPIRYHKDGKFSLFGESGTWRLRGRLLTEVTTFVDTLHPDSDGAEPGKPHVSELTFVDANRFMKKFQGGDVREFRRCP